MIERPMSGQVRWLSEDLTLVVTTLLVVVLAELLLELLWWRGVVRVVVWLITVLLIVELLGPLLRLVLRLLLVDEVLALGLSEVVYTCTSKASEHLFGETVVDLLSCKLLALLSSILRTTIIPSLR